ncbi:transglycosylase SLT domain-containing protein [Paraburkholderia phenazinium]|uniref:transglycosylase SLT domain-containing protein n=1 Tax=Paraburkholderia phenazinium TaxID=60549 RepID=UPI001FC85028|nr:transglycosylase SLT domain-containing protein [Paraburkholderia phenazinium]
MNKRVLLAFLLALGAMGARGATITQVISPVSLVIADAGVRRVVTLDGTPVLYCGLNAFSSWALPLVGQAIGSDNELGMTVEVQSHAVSLREMLIRNGWLEPSRLDDDAQAAITERRGGWACAATTAMFQAMHTSIDPKVLAGVALNESAFNGRPWPWTLNVAGQGFFFRTRADAYQAIQTLLSAHRCDFDIGLMQVNWCFHSSRFASPWEALAPATNIRVAEDILNENYSRTHSVAKAIAYYHSANPVPGQAYLARFARHLTQIEAGL